MFNYYYSLKNIVAKKGSSMPYGSFFKKGSERH